MTKTPITSLQEHPAFRALSQAGLTKVNENAKMLRFRIGQTIADRATMPANVVLLLNGQARLLGREKGQLVTRLGVNMAEFMPHYLHVKTADTTHLIDGFAHGNK